MPEQKKEPSVLKVTDKRIFTSEGEVKDEFRNEFNPVEPQPNAPRPAEAPKAEPEPKPSEAPLPQEQRSRQQSGENPGTPFSLFLEGIIAQAYSTLGLIPDPSGRQRPPNPTAARQLIDIIAMLEEKTRGNLSVEEKEFIDLYLGELRLAYVQLTKTI